MTDTDTLDVAKFGLEAYKTSADLQLKALAARADFAFRMSEVVEKQVKVATDATRLKALQAAVRDYQRAKHEVEQESRALTTRFRHIEESVERIPHLLRGETATEALVSAAWTGFWYLTNHAITSTIMAMNAIECLPIHRQITQFYRPGKHAADLPNGAEDIAFGMKLMQWAANQNMVPRFGTESYALLAKLLETLGAGAAPLLANSQQQADEAESELKRVREKSWELIDIPTTQQH